jgi:hypothetical protein
VSLGTLLHAKSGGNLNEINPEELVRERFGLPDASIASWLQAAETLDTLGCHELAAEFRRQALLREKQDFAKQRLLCWTVVIALVTIIFSFGLILWLSR